MNFNIAAYFMFLSMISLIVIIIGRICYTNGNVFVNALLPGHEDLCLRINKLLLTGYYLINIGYAAMTLISWQEISSFNYLIEIIAYKTAIIVSALSLLHYLNIFLITNYIKKLI